MNWEPQNQTLIVLQHYLGSALVAMLNIHLLIIFLKWLLKRRDWSSEREEQPNSELIPDY
jgi:flagellar biogenesis protein FliO